MPTSVTSLRVVSRSVLFNLALGAMLIANSSWLPSAVGVEPQEPRRLDDEAATPIDVNSPTAESRYADEANSHAGANGATSPRGEQPASFDPLPQTRGERARPAAPPELRPSARNSLALKPPAERGENEQPRRTAGTLGTMIASLCLVLGLFFLVAWLMKRGLPQGARPLPTEVVELLGRAPLAARQHVHLLRVGNKLLLVALTAGGAETLTEITDPVEVDRLAGLCQQAHPLSSTNAFRQIFQQFARRGESDSPHATHDTDSSTAAPSIALANIAPTSARRSSNA